MSYKGVKTLCERTDNWTVWSGKVEMRIRKIRYAWEHVLGHSPTPKVDIEKWELAKYEALDVIMTHIGGTIENETTGYIDPNMLWKRIESMFKDRKGMEKCMALTKLMNTKLDDDVNEYLKLFAQARLKCVEIGWTFDDIFYAINLVNNLNVEFGPLKQLLLAKGDDLKYSDAYDIISAEGLSQQELEKSDTALKVESRRTNGSRRRGPRCYRCNSAGHYIKDCRRKLVDEDEANKITDSIDSDSDYVYVISSNSEQRRQVAVESRWILASARRVMRSRSSKNIEHSLKTNAKLSSGRCRWMRPREASYCVYKVMVEESMRIQSSLTT